MQKKTGSFNSTRTMILEAMVLRMEALELTEDMNQLKMMNINLQF